MPENLSSSTALHGELHGPLAAHRSLSSPRRIRIWRMSPPCASTAYPRHGPYHRSLLSRQAVHARSRQGSWHLVPDFVHVLNYDAIREFMARVPAPGCSSPARKPSGIGMKKIQSPTISGPGWTNSATSNPLSSRAVRSRIVLPRGQRRLDREVLFAEPHAMARLRSTYRIMARFHHAHPPRQAAETKKTADRKNREVIEGLGYLRASPAEFLKSARPTEILLHRIAARVGGATSPT